MRPFYIILIFLGIAGLARAQEGPVLTMGAEAPGATIEANYHIGPNFGLTGYSFDDVTALDQIAPFFALGYEKPTKTIGVCRQMSVLYIPAASRLLLRPIGFSPNVKNWKCKFSPLVQNSDR